MNAYEAVIILTKKISEEQAEETKNKISDLISSNGEVVSVAIRSYILEYSENGEEIYTYYLSDGDTSVGKEVWEKAAQTFLTGKNALDASVCWKNLYETEIAEKKVLGWFLLLAESLDGAV